MVIMTMRLPFVVQRHGEEQELAKAFEKWLDGHAVYRGSKPTHL